MDTFKRRKNKETVCHETVKQQIRDVDKEVTKFYKWKNFFTNLVKN